MKVKELIAKLQSLVKSDPAAADRSVLVPNEYPGMYSEISEAYLNTLAEDQDGLYTESDAEEQYDFVVIE